MQLIGKLDLGGLAYTACYATPREVPALQGLDGYTDFATSRIYLDVALQANPARAANKLAHELVHGLLEDTGAARMLQSAMRCDDAAWSDMDENLARILAPAIAGLLESSVKL